MTIRMHRRVGTACASGLIIWLYAVAAGAGTFLAPAWLPTTMTSFHLTGHAGLPDPAVPRVRGVVTALGAPDDQGNIYIFEAQTVDRPVVLNELKSWRLTIVSGERLASVFQVRTNTANIIEVTSPYGPLNGLAEGDLFFAEKISPPPPPRRPAN